MPASGELHRISPAKKLVQKYQWDDPSSRDTFELDNSRAFFVQQPQELNIQIFGWELLKEAVQRYWDDAEDLHERGRCYVKRLRF